MRRLPIAILVAEVEHSGGAVDPPHVLALCTAVRKYANIVEDLAGFVEAVVLARRDAGRPNPPELDAFLEKMTAKMIDAKTAIVP